MEHVLLTGATGFLGSHLLDALLKQGFRVTILKRSTSDTWRINALLNQVSSFDIDRVAIADGFKSRKVDAVIHTACSYGRHGEVNHEVVETNLLFSLKVLDTAIEFGVNTFLNTDTLLPKYLNAYSLSKKHFAEWLKQSSKYIKTINLKIEHMYGPKDDDSKFVPWLISQLEKQIDRIPLTEGTQLRDFIYIDDVVSAYLLVLLKAQELEKYSEFEVGTGQSSSVREFVTNIYNVYKWKNSDAKTQLGFGDIPVRGGEPTSIKVNNTDLKKLGWNSQISQKQGLEKLLKVVS
jgi:CDP-paratose synthetase